MDFNAYVAFFKNLAEKHTDIAHVDGSSESFFRLNIEEIVSSMRSKIDADSYVLMLEVFEFGGKDQDSENFIHEYTGAFSIIKRNPKLDDYTREEEIFEECKVIAIEVAKRIYLDSLDYDNRIFLDTRYSNYNYTKVGPIFGNWSGCRCQFTFSDNFSMEPDVSKWSDL